MIPNTLAKESKGVYIIRYLGKGEESTNTPSVYHQRVCRVDSTLASKRTYSNTHKKTEVRGVIP